MKPCYSFSAPACTPLGVKAQTNQHGHAHEDGADLLRHFPEIIVSVCCSDELGGFLLARGLGFNKLEQRGLSAGTSSGQMPTVGREAG